MRPSVMKAAAKDGVGTDKAATTRWSGGQVADRVAPSEMKNFAQRGIGFHSHPSLKLRLKALAIRWAGEAAADNSTLGLGLRLTALAVRRANGLKPLAMTQSRDAPLLAPRLVNAEVKRKGTAASTKSTRPCSLLPCSHELLIPSSSCQLQSGFPPVSQIMLTIVRPVPQALRCVLLVGDQTGADLPQTGVKLWVPEILVLGIGVYPGWLLSSNCCNR